MLKVFILIIGLAVGVACTNGAYAEQPVQSVPATVAPNTPQVDALAELGELSEGEILLIEHCLSTLYYYPNQLTGKSSVQLVEAIKQYQKRLHTQVTGILTHEDNRSLRETWMSFVAGVLLPQEYVFNKTDDGIEIAGSWQVQQNKDTYPSTPNAVRLVCLKTTMECYEAFSYFGSAAHVLRDVGVGGVFNDIQTYKIKKFTDMEILTDTAMNFHSMGIKSSESQCVEEIIFIDLQNKTTKKIGRLNPQLSECSESKVHNLYIATYIMRDGRQETIRRRFAELRDMSVTVNAQYALLLERALQEAEKQDRMDRKFYR